MTTPSELMPCPFCGGKAEQLHGFYVQDVQCKICGAIADTDKWNTRTPAPMTEDEIVAAALEAGFMLSTAHGQSENKLMPVSDKDTLMAFVRAINHITKSGA